MLAASLLLTLLAPLANAAAVRQPRGDSAPSPWVTVNSDGYPTTVTPTVSHGSTISPPPASLTKTAAHVLSVNGHTTTTTGSLPVATAAGPGAAGAFMVCNNYQGVGAPFCQPETGTELVIEHTYYVTWDASFFAPDTMVRVEVDFSNGGGIVYDSLIEASGGFCAWTLGESILASQDDPDFLNATLYLSYNTTVSDKTVLSERQAGPNILLTKKSLLGQARTHHVSPLAIALPIVFGLVFLALLGFCVWSWRHHSQLPFLGGFAKKRMSSFSAKGYAVDKPPQLRPSKATIIPAVHVRSAAPPFAQPPSYPGAGDDHVGSPLPEPGTNVFRQEMRRQEEEDQRHQQAF